MYNAPSFWNIKEFADLLGQHPDHVRHGARNFYNPNKCPHNRAKLPAGYGAFKWGDIFIVYDLSEKAAVAKLFNVQL